MENQGTETEPRRLYTTTSCIMYKSLLSCQNELPHYFNSKLNISHFTSLFWLKPLEPSLSAGEALKIRPAQTCQRSEIVLKYAIFQSPICVQASSPPVCVCMCVCARARACQRHFKEQCLSVGQSAVTRHTLQAAPLHRFDSVIPHTAWRGPLNFYLLIKITKLPSTVCPSYHQGRYKLPLTMAGNISQSQPQKFLSPEWIS